MNSVNTEHYKQGEKARRNGAKVADNPYGHGGHHTEWKLGWENEDRVIKGLEAPHDFLRFLNTGT